MRTSFAVNFLALGLAMATQAANFDLPREIMSKYRCNYACSDTFKRFLAVDMAAVGKDFDFDFYGTANNFTNSKPGDLLKIQPLDPTKLDTKAGTTAYRIQYTSVGAGNETVPVTGFVAFPYSSAGHSEFTEDGDNEQFRLVAYAHETSGLYHGCAPSNGPSLFDHENWQLLTQRGFAVVGTDYAGLGNNQTSHRFMNFPTHANDIYYSVKAAQKAFGNVLSEQWVAVGHGEGGGAVWRLAETNFGENKGKHPKTGYLGAVALAPVTRVVDQLLDMAIPVTASILGHAPHLALAIQGFEPSYFMTLLNGTVKDRMHLAARGQLCETGLRGLTFDHWGYLDNHPVISYKGIERDRPLLDKWQEAVMPGAGTTTKPVLMMQGLNDTTIVPTINQTAHKKACDEGSNQIDLRLFPGVGHSTLPIATAPEWLRWIEDRFESRPTSGQCCVKTRKPFDALHVKAPIDPDMPGENPRPPTAVGWV